MLKKTLISLSSVAAIFAAASPVQGQTCSSECVDRAWFEADFLYWQVQNSPKIIPLVIDQPVAGGPFTVVLGGRKKTNDWHSGARFALGYWFDDCKNIGAEASYFFLGTKSKEFNVASDATGSPRLVVPYFNVTTGLPDSADLAIPGLYSAQASLRLADRMQGAEFNLINEPCENIKLLAGFRYWNFDDSVTFYASSPLVVTPTVYNNRDRFFTQNNFFGGQIGVSFDQNISCFEMNLKGKVAFGAMNQKSTITGRFKTNEFTGSVETFSGGYFAQPSNIGSHKKTRFSVIPELNASIGFHMTEDLSFHFGYSVLYVTEVLRAGKQMSSKINPTQSANIEFTSTPDLIGEASPKARMRSSGLWTQGINAGLNYTF